MRYLYLLFALTLVSPLLCADITLVSSDRQGVVLQWKLDSYEISTVGNYTVVEFLGGSGFYAIGKPNLPAQQTFLEIPQGAAISLSVENPSVETRIVDAPIVPTQEPDTDAIGEQYLARAFIQDEEAYRSNEPFPANVVEVAYQGDMRGRRLALIRFNPIQYVAAANELRVHKEMTVRVQFSGSDRELAQTDNAMDPIASAMVINYQPARLSYEDGPDYLIITVPALEAQAKTYADFKKEQGRNVKLEVVNANPAVSAVKDIIKANYPQVKYVLIIGDYPLISLPTSGKRHPLGDERCRQLGLEDGGIPSDNYYACVEGADYYPDIYIGRIPAANAAEADVLIGKLIKYQKNPPPGEWRKRFLMCGEFQYQYSNTKMAERLFCETAFVVWNSLKGKYVFPARTIGTGSSGLNHSEYFFRKAANPSDPSKPGTYRSKIRDANPPVVECKMPAEWARNIVADGEAKINTINFWNEGAFWVQHRDHGGETLWGKPSLNKTDVQKLQNGDKLPILFSVNCLTGAMDYSSDCFVEAALKNPNGGAAAAIGSTRVSYSWWNDRLCDGFYTCVFGTEVYDCFDTGVKLPTEHPFSKKLGVVLNFGKMYLARNYPSNPWGTSSDYTETEFYLFHCIGDPDMEIWTDFGSK